MATAECYWRAEGEADCADGTSHRAPGAQNPPRLYDDCDEHTTLAEAQSWYDAGYQAVAASPTLRAKIIDDHRRWALRGWR